MFHARQQPSPPSIEARGPCRHSDGDDQRGDLPQKRRALMETRLRETRLRDGVAGGRGRGVVREEGVCGVRHTVDSIPRARRVFALPLLAVFLTVLGARLWLIQSYGSDVPFWDQWDAEGALLYKPLLERGPGAVDWFAAWNEHRIMLTRLTAAVLLLVNGQWDPLLQESCNAVCAAAIATLLGVSAVRLMPDRSIGLIWIMVIIGLALPFGFENTLAGFQSSFYYAILFALTMFDLCAYHGLLTWKRSAMVIALAMLSLVTLGSGALACLAAVCALVARIVFARQADTRRVAALIAVLIALALIGYATTPVVERALPFHAKSFSQFAVAFNLVLGWPSPFGALIWLPFAGWCWRTIARRRIDPPGIFLVGLAVFVMLSAAAIATARGSSMSDVTLIATRYGDFAWLGWLANLMAALLLTSRSSDGRSTRVRRWFTMLVFIGAGVAIGQAGVAGLAGSAERSSYYAMETANTRNYLTTGDPAALRDKVSLQIPYWDAARLIQLLDDPTIRAMLPPGLRSDGQVGRLRGVVAYLLSIGKGMTLFGLALFLASTLYRPSRRLDAASD